mgnify:CR=1 FL=1
MEIKRYNPICVPLGDGSYMPEMQECANGQYYSRADLIAAGCLVPVPDGRACEYGDSNCDLMTVDGVLVGFDGCGCHVWLHGENEDKAIHSGTTVQPVLLKRLEDVG